MGSRVVIANPGSVPEMIQMANALGGSGMLRAYIAPFGPTKSELERSMASVLGPAGRAMLRQLERRAVREAVGRADRYQAASAHELAVVTGIRLGLPLPVLRRLAAWRNGAFETSVARRLVRGDSDLIVPAGAALTALATAKNLGVRAWLDCPIAHHRFSTRIQREEAKLAPDFASSLQISGRAEGQRLDQEISTADELIVLSGFQRRTFLEEGVQEDRLHVLPLGVDIELFRPTPKVEDGVFTIGFVGQLTQRKGISYLLSAFDAMRPGGARMLMVGRPSSRHRPWNREGVEHVPAVARTALPQYYHRMDVFVLPSLVEGFPLTALEAMACGVPVIVSENTFGADVVSDGENGFVVPIRDVDAIVDRLRFLADHPADRIAIGKNARATAERYSWAKFAERLMALLASPETG
jgi:glycosyltransferase involved in cell wall biosynthesis